MNVKGRKAKKQANTNNSMNVLSQEEIARRIAAVEADLKSSTWKNLEVGTKFDKNAKLTFINDDMLILGKTCSAVIPDMEQERLERRTSLKKEVGG